ncbi:metallophosphoesterase [Clostridium sporogenes]|uniref:metallophosphoesterase family protein n=1 Tax=Clostridium sporogenes TaxID=1509 RepID=UPI0022377699|nr:metallophosphoesterase [Clostridium sporogenes]MCW6076606.1 metallophosphoesterase [Clostridium sporogenes]
MNLRWLHLSDIHFNFENYDTKKMRKLLLKYLKQEFFDKIDFIVITGDIAYQNKGYTQKMKKFIQDIVNAVGTNIENLYIIPGNHDLKRKGNRGFIVESILKDSNPDKRLSELNKSEYNKLLNGQENYFKFYRDIFQQDYPKTLHYVKKNEKYNIVHINTCLVSGMDGEEGKLVIDQNTLFDVLEESGLEAEKDKLNIAIGHHDCQCLELEERKKFLNNLADYNICLYMAGHYHRAHFSYDNFNVNELYQFICGSNMLDDYSEISFIYGEADIDTGSSKVIYHKYGDEKWDIKTDLPRRYKKGVISFDIENLKKKDSEIEIDDEQFKNFLVEFNKKIQAKPKVKKADLEGRDIEGKFCKMKCSITFEKDFEQISVYFDLVTTIIESGDYMDLCERLEIRDLIVNTYYDVYYKYDNGVQIGKAMIDNLFEQYKDKKSYSASRLKLYIKILVYWYIYECEIFNENKRDE